MPVQIGAKPDSGFDDPIGMLKDCHRRIESFLDILCAVVERARARTLSSEETAAVQSALHYFRTGGQRHNSDEEDSLFPRLRANLAAGSVEEIAGLESDHHTANELHTQIDILYIAWITNACLSEEDAQCLLGATQRLKHLYAEHIRVEEEIVFPRAAQVLDTQAIGAIGQEFRDRRR
jgi:hemerythrin-like domain-containing protein